jgi:hypothetical protein
MNVRVADPSPMGNAPIYPAADSETGTFYLATSRIVEGEGDATTLLKGTVAP